MYGTEVFRLHNMMSHVLAADLPEREHALSALNVTAACVGCHTPSQECRKTVERCAISMSPVAGPKRQI